MENTYKEKEAMSKQKPERKPVGSSDFQTLRTKLTDEGNPMPYCDTRESQE